jgi:hypothetical protein
LKIAGKVRNAKFRNVKDRVLSIFRWLDEAVVWCDDWICVLVQLMFYVTETRVIYGFNYLLFYYLQNIILDHFEFQHYEGI